MNKDEYKKVLIDLRNNYIDYKKNLENELINSLSSSFIKQKEYLEDEGAIVGFEFTPDIKLIFQTFRVVYK